MAFRDDHEAAVARIDALEAELARAREDDVEQSQRIERLEEQLAAAKRKLGSTEEELDQYRPRPRPAVKPVRRSVAASEPMPMRRGRPDRAAAIAVAVLLVAIVVVGVVLMLQSGSLDR